jgi:penicillin-binding protein 1A
MNFSRIQLSNKKLLLLLGGAFVVLSLFISSIYSSFAERTVSAFQESLLEQNENTIFYDISGKPFHVIRGAEDRRYVPLNKISKTVQKAVVAIEDSRFFNHGGFDLIRIFGAIWHLLRGGTYVQGASTITQQLVKLSLLTPQRTITRKVKEIFMAMV